jgi:hypothetical protein
VNALVRWFHGHNVDYFYRQDVDGEPHYEAPVFRVRLFVAWYDAWVGVYVDRKTRQVYVFPVPCIGFQVGYQCPSNAEAHASATKEPIA